MQQTLSDCEQVLDKVTLCPLQPHSLTLSKNAWMAKLASDNLKDCSLCISQNILTICQYNKKEPLGVLPRNNLFQDNNY